MAELLVPPFPEHDASGADVTAQGTRLKTRAGDVEHVNADLTSAHNTATEGVSGDLATLVKGKDGPAKHHALQLVQKLTSSGGTLTVLGGQITDYEHTLDRLHGLIRQHEKLEQQQKERRRLAPQAEGAQEDLRSQAGRAKGSLDDPLAPATIQRLTRLGAMPVSVRALYPQAHVTAEQQVTGLQAKISAGELPRFSEMKPEDIQTFLTEHPELAATVPALLRASEPSEDLKALVEAQARNDADHTRDGLDDEPGQSALDKIDAGDTLLETINRRLAHGEKLTATEAAYIAQWTNHVGAAGLATLPKIVTDSVYKTHHPPSVRQSDIDQYLAPVADAILNYSDVSKHQEGAVDTAGYKGGSTFTPFDGRITMDEMPQAVRDLVDLRIGEQEEGYRLGDAGDDETGGSFTDIKNLDTFNGWAELLSHATKGDEATGAGGVAPGDDFARALGHQAIQAKQDMNAILGSAGALSSGMSGTEPFDGIGSREDMDALRSALDDRGASSLLGVTARNESASSDLMLDTGDRKTILGMNWDWDSGAADLVRAATDADPAGGGGTDKQAAAALAVFKEVGGHREAYLGGLDGNPPARMQENVSDAVVDAGITWMDEFGRPVDSDDYTGEGEEEGTVTADGFSMSAATQADYLRFVSATGTEDATRFHAAATADSQSDLANAMNGRGDLDLAMQRAGRLEGAINGADYEHLLAVAKHTDDVDNAEAAARHLTEQRGEGAVKLLLSAGVAVAGTATGPAYPVTTALLSTGAGALIGEIGDDETPEAITDAQDRAEGYDQSRTRRDSPYFENRVLINAALQSGTLDDAPSNLVERNENGTLQLRADATASDIEGFQDRVHEKYDIDSGDFSDYWNSEFDGRNSGTPTDETDDPGGWNDHENAGRALYGDNFDTYLDDRFLKTHPDDDRYATPTDPDKIDDDPY